MRKRKAVSAGLAVCLLTGLLAGCSLPLGFMRDPNPAPETTMQTTTAPQETSQETTAPQTETTEISTEAETTEAAETTVAVTEAAETTAATTNAEPYATESKEGFSECYVYNPASSDGRPIMAKIVAIHRDIDKVKALVAAYDGIYQIDPDDTGSSITEYAVIEYQTYYPDNTQLTEGLNTLNHTISASLVNKGSRDGAALKYDGLTLISSEVNISGESFLEKGEVFTGYTLATVFKHMPSEDLEVKVVYGDKKVYFSSTGEYIETIID